MFDVRLIDGSLSFLDNESEVAVTDETAMRIFGTTDVIGKNLYPLSIPHMDMKQKIYW